MCDLLHPITFSIPRVKVLNNIPEKKKILSSIIPGRMETYIWNEFDYYNEYRSSLFAVTTLKGGWDCMRHYEIIANGCLPYFPNIEKCPKNTMFLLPKDLILESNMLFEKYVGSKAFFAGYDNSDLSIIPLDLVYDLINRFFNYMNEYLLTEKVAEYVLKKSLVSPRNILFLSSTTDWRSDYLKDLTLHGLKMLLGSKCHEYPRLEYLYTDSMRPEETLWGRGVTFGKLLDPSLHDSDLTNTIEQDISDKKYDIVIFGSYHRGMPYYDLVKKHYSPEKIILLCGEDLHNCNCHNYTGLGNHVFVRELN